MTPNENIIALIIFVLAFGAAGYFFVRRAAKLVSLLRIGQQKPEENRFAQPAVRSRLFLSGVLGQSKLWRSFVPGLAHALTFWGFLVIQLGLLQLIVHGIFGLGFRIPILDSRVFAALLDVMCVLVLVSIAYFSYRRAFIKPRQLTTTRDAWNIIALITLVVLTLLLAEAFLWRGLPNDLTSEPPIGRRLGDVLVQGAQELPRSTRDLAFTLYGVTWWAHVLVVLGFLVYLPQSKHLHLLSSPFSAYFQALKPKGRMRPIENIEDQEHFGANKVEDFTWRDLLDTYACTECGRCTAVCPANNTGKPLNPKKIIIDTKTRFFAQSGLKFVGHGNEQAQVAHESGEAGAVEKTVGAGAADSGNHAEENPLNLPALVGGLITEDELWSCTTCRACMQECPVFIEHVPKIMDMRRYLVLEESNFPQETQPLFTNLERNGNPWQIRNDERADWTSDAGVDVPVLAELDDGQAIEVLFWVGCMGSFDQRNKKISQNLVQILNDAGIPYGILGPEEQCTGDPARRIGNEYLYQTLAQMNIETLNGYKEQKKFTKIVTACPHCFNTIKNEYPDFGGHFEVVHHTKLLEQLVAEGRIKTGDGLDANKITYHDPCYLGRYNDIYEAPRFVLNQLGNGLRKVDLVEMPRNKSKSFCCGGGGGRVWMEENIGTRVNQARIQEAADTGADVVAASCPFCITMFEDGIKGKNLGDKLKVMDVTELIQISRKPRKKVEAAVSPLPSAPSPATKEEA